MTAAAKPGLREPLLTFLAATALACGLYWLAEAITFLQDYVHAAIAVIFLYGPAVAARRSRRPFDYGMAGLTIEPVALNLRVLGVALLVTWPVFLVVFVVFYRYVCHPHAPALVQDFVERFVPMCARWLDLRGARPRLPPKFLTLALNQILVVAVPEELFFRGYLLGRLEERWASSRRLFGAAVGWPLLVSSALFALGHVMVDFNVQRLVVFFPALVFGWMRARTGSIAAGALFHALCNLLMAVMVESFFA